MRALDPATSGDGPCRTHREPGGTSANWGRPDGIPKNPILPLVTQSGHSRFIRLVLRGKHFVPVVLHIDDDPAVLWSILKG